MANRIIEPVKNNQDKRKTYSIQKGRYKKAMREGFYFEAMMIDYAMLEDRLLSMIYHMGFLANRKTITIWKSKRDCLKSIVFSQEESNAKKSLGIKAISGKIMIVRNVLEWVSNVEGGYQNDNHLSVLKSQCESLDIELILSTLKQVEEWCKYRNEVIHASLNKNITDLYSNLPLQAELGMEYAKTLDNQVRILKKGNIIRRRINAPVEK